MIRLIAYHLRVAIGWAETGRFGDTTGVRHDTGTISLIVVILVLVGALPTWP